MQLTVHQGATAGWSTLDVRTFPFIVGNSAQDVGWDCPCGRPLGRGLDTRQVMNLLVRCGGCGLVLESPLRPPGAPIAGRPVYLPPDGTYLLEGQLDVIDKPVMMVGHGALHGYARETGRLIPDVYDPALKPILTSLDASSLMAVANRLQSLLGIEYDRLHEADARGLRSPTPPRSRQRLVELIEFARAAARDLADWDGRGGVSLDGNLLAESVTYLSAAQRWRNHPAWPAMRASLASETEPPHTIMLLTVASYLVDANNGVGVHVGNSRQNVAIPDMWIEPALGQQVSLEVKTPIALRGPGAQITEPRAIQILERALKKSSRQRGATGSSLLIVGGYHVGSSFDKVVSAARGMLALERRKWRRMAGIVLVDCTYEGGDTAENAHFAPIARVEIARHPGYTGDLSLVSDPVATAEIPRGLRPS